MTISHGGAAERRRRRNTGAIVLFDHTFKSADSAVSLGAADTGQNMVVTAGSGAAAIYGVTGHKAYLANVNGATDYTQAVADVLVNNCTIEWFMEARPLNDSILSTGGCFRYQDALNYYIWDIGDISKPNDYISLYRRDAGGFHFIANTPADIDTTVACVAKVVLKDDNVKFYFNNTLKIDISGQSTLQNATKMGLSHTSALKPTRYTRLRVTA